MDFNKIYQQIKETNKLETKETALKFIKFDEEYGEMCSEYLKLVGGTYKKFDKEALASEMADTLQVLLSIFSDIEDKTEITIGDVFAKLEIKNKKWRDKISEYTSNKK